MDLPTAAGSGRSPMAAGVFVLALVAAALLAGCAGTTGAAGSGRAAGVEGTVFAPAEGVSIHVYRKGTDPSGPADIILPAPTTADGSFTIDLPPGEYTLVARHRSSRESAGPLSAGDRRSPGTTVTVGSGGRVPLNLLMTAKEVSGRTPYPPPKEWTTAIAGTVRDADGNPVEGTRVHVYTYVQMSERPKYVSERTGPDGKYVVYLPEAGTYYVAARNRFGGPPRIGDLYGRYDEGSINPTGVVVRQDEKREGIDIIVFKVW